MFAKEPLPGRELDIAVGRADGMDKPEEELWWKPSTDTVQALQALDKYAPWELSHSPSDSHYGDYTPEHWTCHLIDEEVEMTSEVSLEHAICHAILKAKEK